VCSLFFRFEGAQPLHKVQSLIFRILMDIPVVGFMNSGPKIFLTKSSDILSISRVVPVFLCCLVAVVSLGPLCYYCITERPSFPGFVVPHCPGCISCDRVPCAVPLLHCGSSSCRLRQIPSTVHNFPGSEFS
jgi:hypothetical protein